MRLIIYLIILILIIPIQTTIVSRMDILGVKPDISLVIVYFIGFLYGEMEGLIMGILIGFVIDLFSPSILGINLLTKSLIGLMAGYIGKIILNPFINPGAIMALSAGCGILTLVILQVATWRIFAFDAIVWVVVPQAIYDAFIGFLAYMIFADTIEGKRLKGIAR